MRGRRPRLWPHKARRDAHWLPRRMPVTCLMGCWVCPIPSSDKCLHRGVMRNQTVRKAEVKSRLFPACDVLHTAVRSADLCVLSRRATNRRQRCQSRRSTKGEPLLLRNSKASLWCRRGRKPLPSLLSASLCGLKITSPVMLIESIATH